MHTTHSLLEQKQVLLDIILVELIVHTAGQQGTLSVPGSY